MSECSSNKTCSRSGIPMPKHQKWLDGSVIGLSTVNRVCNTQCLENRYFMAGSLGMVRVNLRLCDVDH